MQDHKLSVHVYYEDTDAMAVVYHANYLHFFERARTDLLDSVGPSVVEWTSQGLIFPIYHVDVTFRAPARLGDDLDVLTKGWLSSPFRIEFDQRIYRPKDNKLLVSAKVEVVCTNLQGSLQQIPASLGLGPKDS